MNRLESCASQIHAVTDWFDALAVAHRRLPRPDMAANDSFIEDDEERA
jgi:hypothetical protein